MMKKWLLIILLIVSIYSVSGQLVASDELYGNVTVGSVNAATGAVICAGQDCISVSPTGKFGTQSASGDSLTVLCESGETARLTIGGTGCSAIGTIDYTCKGGGGKYATLLPFSGTCGETAAASTGGGGGGGGSGGGALAGPSVGSTTDLASDTGYNTGESTTITMTQGDRASVTVAGTDYKITLFTLKENFVVLKYNEDFTTLQVGESRAVDLNGDGAADVKVTLSGIEGGEATLEFQKLTEISKATGDEKDKADEQAKEDTQVTKEKAPLKGIIVTIIIVGLGLLGYYVYINKPKTE
tara:strand:- start:9991 stop:10887 length:897 start_codon:yes stop_codon:yes gene_type:complete